LTGRMYFLSCKQWSMDWWNILRHVEKHFTPQSKHCCQYNVSAIQSLQIYLHAHLPLEASTVGQTARDPGWTGMASHPICSAFQIPTSNCNLQIINCKKQLILCLSVYALWDAQHKRWWWSISSLTIKWQAIHTHFSGPFSGLLWLASMSKGFNKTLKKCGSILHRSKIINVIWSCIDTCHICRQEALAKWRNVICHSLSPPQWITFTNLLTCTVPMILTKAEQS